MSSKKSAPALQIDLQPSRYLYAFILISHGGALTVPFLLGVELWIRLLIAIPVLLSLYRCRHGHRHGYQSLRWDSSETWWLTDATGHEHAGQLLPASYVHPLMIVLRFKVQKRVRSLVLLSDSADRDLLRRLRVRLKQTS